MKEPKGHFEQVDADDYGDYDWQPVGLCAKDGERWPCRKWEAWLASPEFRLKAAESRLDTQGKVIAEQGKELHELRDKVQLLHLLFMGYNPAIDFAVTELGGSIKYTRTADVQRVYDHSKLAGEIVTGMVNHKVTFKDRDGSVWENGQNVERHYHK